MKRISKCKAIAEEKPLLKTFTKKIKRKQKPFINVLKQILKERENDS